MGKATLLLKSVSWKDDDEFDKNDANDDCLVAGFDKHPLVLAENPRSHQFYVPLDSPKVE